jgi:hypothetical protein
MSNNHWLDGKYVSNNRVKGEQKWQIRLWTHPN